ncbi:hypothetical protein BMB171_C0383 [Bacillus thuringiensis BMB171]|nr:hypothetical protein BMB171_C0383 [Bacillus thuringiensis BMB171]
MIRTSRHNSFININNSRSANTDSGNSMFIHYFFGYIYKFLNNLFSA